MASVEIIFEQVYLYALVREAVNGRGRVGRGTDGRTNDDRGKDVVPLHTVTFKITQLRNELMKMYVFCQLLQAWERIPSSCCDSLERFVVDISPEKASLKIKHF